MYLKIGNTDVTSAVQESTYKIDRVKSFERWFDANNREHHSNVHYKVSGSFDMVFLPSSIEYDDFKSLIDDNTIGDVTTLSLSVNNLDGEIVSIDCFITISFSPIIDLKNGSGVHYKRCTISVQEC